MGISGVSQENLNVLKNYQPTTDWIRSKDGNLYTISTFGEKCIAFLRDCLSFGKETEKAQKVFNRTLESLQMIPLTATTKQEFNEWYKDNKSRIQDISDIQRNSFRFSFFSKPIVPKILPIEDSMTQAMLRDLDEIGCKREDRPSEGLVEYYLNVMKLHDNRFERSKDDGSLIKDRISPWTINRLKKEKHAFNVSLDVSHALRYGPTDPETIVEKLLNAPVLKREGSNKVSITLKKNRKDHHASTLAQKLKTQIMERGIAQGVLRTGKKEYNRPENRSFEVVWV